MKFVATLITDPVRADLGADSVERVGAFLTALSAKVSAPDWLDDSIACDIFVEAETLPPIRDALRAEFGDAAFDLVIQPTEGRRKSLLMADMDSTIVIGETLDELAARAGLKEQISAITERAMRGEIDFKGALRERVGMLKGLAESALTSTLAETVLTGGAETLVRTMRAHGAYTALVSGGFRFFTRHIAGITGFHENRANELLIEDGVLTGEVAEPILDKESKLASLREIAAARDIPLSATMATGDGANDLPMIQASGLGVAFRAKPMVEAKAPASIRHGDLTALLYIQGYRRPEFSS
jgi:phosphoserine phosphatase